MIAKQQSERPRPNQNQASDVCTGNFGSMGRRRDHNQLFCDSKNSYIFPHLSHFPWHLPFINCYIDYLIERYFRCF